MDNNNNNNNSVISGYDNKKKKKRTFGVMDLPKNVKTIDVEFDMDILKKVEEEDKEHMILVIEHFCYNIAKKSDDIKLYIHVSKEDGIIIYQLFASLPTNITISSKDFDDIKNIQWKKIIDPIEVTFNEKDKLFTFRTIIYASKNLPQTEEITYTHIRFKIKQPVIIYETDKNDDQRGSTKRTRK